MSTSKSYPVRIIECCSAASRRRSLILLLAITAIVLSTTANAAVDEKLAVLPFEIVDNTPVPGGNERNQRMLEKLTRFIGQAIGEAGLFDVIPQSEVDAAVSAAELGTYIHTCNRCEYDLAGQVGGDKVMVGWIYKMSLLILTMHIEIKDVAGEKLLISKAYDFRGDNEKAWLRAAEYMVRDLETIMEKQNP